MTESCNVYIRERLKIFEVATRQQQKSVSTSPAYILAPSSKIKMTKNIVFVNLDSYFCFVIFGDVVINRKKAVSQQRCQVTFQLFPVSNTACITRLSSLVMVR
jgi:hypothetical protein